MNLTVNVRVTDKLDSITRSKQSKIANGLNNMANDLMVGATPRTPKLTGALRKNRRKTIISDLKVIVTWLQPYSEVQENGRAGSRIMRRYTTPGTGKHFVLREVQRIKRNVARYFR